MRSAREIAAACLPPVDDCIGPAECASCMGDHDARERIAEAIQAAREDGARWALERFSEYELDHQTGEPKQVTVDSADVRKVAP